MNLLQSGHFNRFEHGIFDPILGSIRNPHDPWMTAADFRAYIDAQSRVAETWRDPQRWAEMAVLNTAASGRFSSDRSIRDYRDRIWGIG